MKFMLTTFHTEDTSIFAIVTLDDGDLERLRKRKDIFLKAREQDTSLCEHNYYEWPVAWYNSAWYNSAYYDEQLSALFESMDDESLEVMKLPDDFELNAKPIRTECNLTHVQMDCLSFSMCRRDSNSYVETANLPYEMLFEKHEEHAAPCSTP